MQNSNQEIHQDAQPANQTITIEEASTPQGPKQPTIFESLATRSEWLRETIIEVTYGLLSTSSLILGMGAMKQDTRSMKLTGFAGLVSGACSMAIKEFVCFYWNEKTIEVKYGDNLPNSVLVAALASCVTFCIGGIVPLLAIWFIKEFKVGVMVLIAVVSVVLVSFGWLGATLGKVPVVNSSVRILAGGWLAMAITYGLAKLIDTIS